MSGPRELARAGRRKEVDPLPAYDLERVRHDFPILHQKVHGKPLIYLDNAASTQKPQAVIDAVQSLYRHDYSNVHRGVHTLSERSTRLFESTREKTRAFINAADSREIIFTSGATGAINLVAQSYGRMAVREGDEILVTELEHHSNIVPWQLLCEQTGAKLRVAPLADDGEVPLGGILELIGERTKLVSIAHTSNALGTILPVAQVISAAHERGIPVLLDGAQAVPHMPVDVRALGADFYAFSAHKVYGPSGVGVLYGRAELLERMPPYQGGGDMIRTVSFSGTDYNDLPWKFEAGTPNVAGVVGMGAALDYVSGRCRLSGLTHSSESPAEDPAAGLTLELIARHEETLLEYANGRLGEIDGLQLVGTAPDKAAVVSFTMRDIHAHDIGTILDREGVAIRAGHHCAQPVMHRFGIAATARASFGLYNNRDEIDRLASAIELCRELFAP